MKKLLWIMMILVTGMAQAGPVATWSGAGPYACMGNCPQSWAETQLTDDELSELKEAQRASPEPYYIPIQDGDVFNMVSYFKDGEPVAYRTTTVAVLQHPTSSVGWHMDGWSFVKLDDCQNWTIVDHKNIYGESGFRTRPNYPRLYSGPKPDPKDDPHDPWLPDFTWDDPWEPDTTIIIVEKDPIPETPVSAVPVPAGILLLVSSLGGLAIIRKKA